MIGSFLLYKSFCGGVPNLNPVNLGLVMRDCPTDTARWKMERRLKNKAMRKTWECLMILGDVDSIVSLRTLGISSNPTYPQCSFIQWHSFPRIALHRIHL